MIIAHRPNDYHADHRACGLLVQDASYILTVPHECPDAPALRDMPLIVYNEDAFDNPPFRADVVIEKYGEERGTKIRYAEAFEVCLYGAP